MRNLKAATDENLKQRASSVLKKIILEYDAGELPNIQLSTIGVFMERAPLEVRTAIQDDLPALVDLLRDDSLGETRESTNLEDYREAFDEITKDPSQVLLVAIINQTVVGTLQVSFLRHLSRKGARRAQLESVRVSSEFRGMGIGRRLIDHALELAQSRNCQLVQLTSDKSRKDAVKFYQSLGFTCSHEGLKLAL